MIESPYGTVDVHSQIVRIKYNFSQFIHLVYLFGLFKMVESEIDDAYNQFIVDESGQISDSQEDSEFLPNQSGKKRKRVQNRAKITHTWSHEEILKLISEVEIRPCVWNVSLKEYKNRFKRDAAWQEIFVLMGEKFPVDELSAKWQNLRTQFRNSVSSAKKTKSGQAATTKPNWKYHSQMEFVNAAEISQTVRSVSNMPIEDTEDSATIVSGSSELSSFSSGEALRHSKQKKTSTLVNVGEGTTSNEALISGMKCAMDRLQQKKPPDDVQIFGNYLIAELRKIKSTSYREETQRELLRLLWDRTDKQPVKLKYFLSFI